MCKDYYIIKHKQFLIMLSLLGVEISSLLMKSVTGLAILFIVMSLLVTYIYFMFRKVDNLNLNLNIYTLYIFMLMQLIIAIALKFLH